MKKLIVCLVIIMTSALAVLAVNRNNLINDRFDANIEALINGEETKPNGQLYGSLDGNKYYCKSGIADNCNTSVTPECKFKN